jgi:hypothetical protein
MPSPKVEKSMLALLGHEPKSETAGGRCPQLTRTLGHVPARRFFQFFRAAGPQGVAVVPLASSARMPCATLPRVRIDVWVAAGWRTFHVGANASGCFPSRRPAAYRCASVGRVVAAVFRANRSLAVSLSSLSFEVFDSPFELPPLVLFPERLARLVERLWWRVRRRRLRERLAERRRVRRRRWRWSRR